MRWRGWRGPPSDHTLDHAHGGPTTDTHTGPICAHDHLVKHDGGWRLRQPEPGHFVWINPPAIAVRAGDCLLQVFMAAQAYPRAVLS